MKRGPRLGDRERAIVGLSDTLVQRFRMSKWGRDSAILQPDDIHFGVLQGKVSRCSLAMAQWCTDAGLKS